jgi:homoserine dehydrogenase
LLGFGNVNRTLAQLLKTREAELRDRHGISFRITGIASRRLGWIADPSGLDPARVEETCVVAGDSPANAGNVAKARPSDHPASTVDTWLKAAQADILFEATSLNVETGQPGVDHIRAALAHGAHAITANKGPIVHAYRELRDLAKAKNKRFLFESTVMDGVPIFSFFDQLPAIHLQGFHGILNSTTNVILREMENGLTFDESLKKAQSLGIAETDATHDVDGWDAAVKTAALITVLMDIPIRLEEIERKGIRDLRPKVLREARMDGFPYKLVCRAKREGSGVKARVGPEKVIVGTPMGGTSGSSSYICFNTDIFPILSVFEGEPGLYATAYGMLADFVRAVAS